LIGTTEPHLQKAIRKYVSAGDTVYDIGANVGYVSLSLAKRVGSKGYVFAFEPVPQNLRLLRTNIENNQLSNVKVFDAAVSDRRGEAIIRIAQNLATASLVWHKDDQAAVELVIKTVIIDELIEAGDLPIPSFIKIDVEGAEGPALLGMHRILAAAKPVIFIECSDSGRETTWELLSGLGYRCQSAITRKAIDLYDEYRHSDFLWLPSGNG
jgi:FkbM family methyltransferase